VKVDNQVPQLASTKDLYDPTSRVFKPGAIIEEGSGLAGKSLTYQKDGETVELSPNQDGNYRIPEGVDLTTVRFSIWDKVHNTNILTLEGKPAPVSTEKENTKPKEETGSETNKPATDGRLEVRIVDEEGNAVSQYAEMMRYQVFDSNGNRIDKEFNTYYESELPRLPFGTYTVKITGQDENYSWVSPTVITVELSKDHPEGVVNFVYRYRDKNRFDVVFDKELPSGTRVFAIHKETGEQHELEQTIYEPKTFEKILLNGDYRILIDLPEGYRALENNFYYSVGEKMNRYLTSFVEVKEDPTPSPSPVPSPFSPEQQPHPSETVTELDQRHQPIPKKTDLRPMYVRPNEKDEKDTHVTPRPNQKETLPNTGQTGDALGLVGLLLSLCGVGFIRQRGKEGQD